MTDTPSTKLEPCPFCGDELRLLNHTRQNGSKFWRLLCTSNVDCFFMDFDDEANAVEMGNRRAGKDGADEKAGLTQASDSRARGPEVDLADMMNAPSGIGPYAHDWSDKPHRVLYDAVKIARALLAREGLREAPRQD